MLAVVLSHHLLNINRSMTLITFSNGNVVMRDGKVGTEQACCCQACECRLWYGLYLNNLGRGSWNDTNYYAWDQCCRYLLVDKVNADGDPPTQHPVPIGFAASSGNSMKVAVSEFQTQCVPRGTLNVLLGEGDLQAGQQSIVMYIENTIVEVFFGNDCCPESIQVWIDPEADYFPRVTGITLATGPTTFNAYLKASDTGADKDYDLYMCGDPPRGTCCLNGVYVGSNMTEYDCMNGFPRGPGEVPTWYANGTTAPCEGNPFP